MNRTLNSSLSGARLVPWLVLAVSLAIPSLAQEPTPGLPPTIGATPEVDEESAQTSRIAEAARFSPGNEAKDPFKPLVVRPPPPQPQQQITPDPKPNPDPGPKPIPPLVINVSGICGNEAERLAMILFENKPYVVHKEMNVDGKFKVVDVLDDRLVVFSFKEQIRRTFPLGGGKE